MPWGLSLAIERTSLELRLFIEARDPDVVTAFAADHGADLDRWNRMRRGLPRLRVWHAVALAPSMRWHAYLCVRDRELARRALDNIGVALPPLRERDLVTMVSMDLTRAERVKSYVLMPEISADELGADAPRFGRAMLGDARPIWWLAAIGPTTALHFGVPRHVDEPTATHRIRELLRSLELPTEPWERARGAHHFVSFQRRAGEPRVTTYFMPEVAR